MSTYTKEWVVTLGFFAAYLLVAHTAVWVLIFDKDNDVRVLGFPLHYFAVLVLGWFGVLAVSLVWNRVADRLDQEITGGEETPIDEEA